MDRKDVLNSSEYWTSKTQIELYNQAQKFMEATGKDWAHLTISCLLRYMSTE